MAFVSSQRHRAAAMANLEKARAAWSAQRRLFPNLKHGAYALDLRKSAILMGEDVREYDAHLALFEKAWTPTTDRERVIVRRMAEAVWRLFRVYRARGRAQARRFREVLELVTPLAPLGPTDIQQVTLRLVSLFHDQEYLLTYTARLRNQFERLVRLLLTERAGSDQGFRIHTHFRLSAYDLEAPFQ